jgi:hypothetical protein
MRRGIFFLIAGILFITSLSYAGHTIKVTFLNPDVKGSNKFYDALTSFMQASASNLGIDLEIVYSIECNRFEYKDLAERILTSASKPDYFISIFKRNISPLILQMAEKENVHYFTINTNVPEEYHQIVGKPRKKYRYWIGQMTPNDIRAGYDLAKILIENAHLNRWY